MYFNGLSINQEIPHLFKFFIKKVQEIPYILKTIVYA